MAEIPLLGGPIEQKLIITFKRRDTGEGDISFSFEPDIIQATSPEQLAAMNVANQIISLFGLDREGEQNAETTDNIQ